MQLRTSIKLLFFLVLIISITACSLAGNLDKLEEPTATFTIEPTSAASPTIEATRTPTSTATAVPPCPTTTLPLPTLSSEYLNLEPEELIRTYFQLSMEGRFIVAYQLLSKQNHYHRSSIIQYIDNGEQGLQRSIKGEINSIDELEVHYGEGICRVFFVEYTATPDPIDQVGTATFQQEVIVVKEDGQWRLLTSGRGGDYEFTCRDYVEGKYP